MNLEKVIETMLMILERGGAAIPMWGPIITLVIGSLPKYQQEFTPEKVRVIVDAYIAKIDALGAERDRLKGDNPEE